MNHKDHITHWRGTPIKEMSRDDLIEALITEIQAGAFQIDRWRALREKIGVSIF